MTMTMDSNTETLLDIGEIETLEFQPNLLEQRKILVRWEPFTISKKEFRWKTKGGYAQSKDKRGWYNQYAATVIEDLKSTVEYRVRYDDTEENLDILRKEYQNRKRTPLYNNALRKYLTTHINIGQLEGNPGNAEPVYPASAGKYRFPVAPVLYMLLKLGFGVIGVLLMRI
jgi:hypothetical protein